MEITREQFIKHLLIEIVGLILVAIGAAGIMKVALGTGAYDALALSISSVTAIEVGTVGLITNCICITDCNATKEISFDVSTTDTSIIPDGNDNQLFLLHSFCRNEFRFLYDTYDFIVRIYYHLFIWRCNDDCQWNDRTSSRKYMHDFCEELKDGVW